MTLSMEDIRHERLTSLLQCLKQHRGRTDWSELLHGVRATDPRRGRVDALEAQELSDTICEAKRLELVEIAAVGDQTWITLLNRRAEAWLKLDGGRVVTDDELDGNILAIVQKEGRRMARVPLGHIMAALKQNERFTFVEELVVILRAKYLAGCGYIEWDPAQPLGAPQITSFHCALTARGEDCLKDRLQVATDTYDYQTQQTKLKRTSQGMDDWTSDEVEDALLEYIWNEEKRQTARGHAKAALIESNNILTGLQNRFPKLTHDIMTTLYSHLVGAFIEETSSSLTDSKGHQLYCCRLTGLGKKRALGLDRPQKQNARKAAVATVNEDNTILFVAANPTDPGLDRIRLDEECRNIEEELKMSGKRVFHVKSIWATRIKDFSRALLECNPKIVHFSGHGSPGGIVLEDETGAAVSVSAEGLAALFKVFKDVVRCVVLNACYSEYQAQAIAAHIGCVIGMKDSIDDSAAGVFAAAFYRSLAHGRNVNDAFNLAKADMQMHGLNDHDLPTITVRQGSFDFA